MADAVDVAPAEPDRRASARLRRRRDDLWIGATALVAALLALPLGRNSWNSPEVAAVLAVSATALLADQRWAIALVVIAELLLIPTVVPRAFAVPSDLTVGLTGLIATVALVPGLLAMRRAAAALVLLSGWERTRATCRRFHAGLIAAGVLAATLPIF